MTAPAEDPRGGEVKHEHFTVTLNGQNVVVAEVPDLTERGLTSLTYDYRHSVQVRSFDDLDGRVLLHEFLHALLRTDPQQVCTAADGRHEDFVRMLTAGLHDVLGYRRPPAAGRGDTDSGGEDRWAGTPWVEAANLAREVLLAEPASWVVYRIGAALAARSAGDRAQPTQDGTT